MLELSERAYLSSRVNAGSAFFHAAITWKTPTFLHDWKRPPFHVVCIRFRFLVFKDVSRFEGPSRQSFCNQDLLLKSEWQIQASVTTRVRVGSLTHTFDLIFLGEFDFDVPLFNFLRLSTIICSFMGILRIDLIMMLSLGL